MTSLRDLGNEHFKAGKFKEAEQLYTQAILDHSRSDPKVFANRALTRIRLQDWRGAEDDSRKAIELYGPQNKTAMKSHYYLAQSLLAQRHVGEALTEAKYAYNICIETKDSSSEILSQFILRTKQALWQSRETARLRDLNSTLGLVEDLLDQKLEQDLADLEDQYRRGNIGKTGRDEERLVFEKDAQEQRKIIRAAFADPVKPETTERVVPDYLIDAITFEIMHDPVITPSGASYERVGLLRHIRSSGLDPLTREPLSEKQLVPNVALRNACSEFLEQNGWAVDY